MCPSPCALDLVTVPREQWAAASSAPRAAQGLAGELGYDALLFRPGGGGLTGKVAVSVVSGFDGADGRPRYPSSPRHSNRRSAEPEREKRRG